MDLTRPSIGISKKKLFQSQKHFWQLKIPALLEKLAVSEKKLTIFLLDAIRRTIFGNDETIFSKCFKDKRRNGKI